MKESGNEWEGEGLIFLFYFWQRETGEEGSCLRGVVGVLVFVIMSIGNWEWRVSFIILQDGFYRTPGDYNIGI